MNRELVSFWPHIGLFFTWLCALLGYRLLPASTQVAPGFYWATMSVTYACALWAGWASRNSRSVLKELARAMVLVLGCGGAWLLAVGMEPSSSPVPTMLFYASAMIQVSLAFTLRDERGLVGSLVISMLMLAFAASRPRSDTPLLLTVVPFMVGVVLTLVSNEVSHSRKAVADNGAGSRGSVFGHLAAGCLTLLACLALGVALLFLTPLGNGGPLDWKLDRDMLRGWAGGSGLASPGELPGDAAGQSGSGQGGALQSFGQTFKEGLSQAMTVGDVIHAFLAAIRSALDQLLGQAQQMLQALMEALNLWHLLALLVAIAIAIAMLLVRRLRLWLRVQVDRCYYWLKPGGTAVTVDDARRLAVALDRLLTLRRMPRPRSHTWSEHCADLQTRHTEGRLVLQRFSEDFEAVIYGGEPSSAYLSRTGEVYAQVYELAHQRRR